VARECSKRYKAEEVGQREEECNHVVTRVNKGKEDSLYLDSAATTTMVASRDLLTRVTPLSKPIQIGVAESGRGVEAKHKGVLILQGAESAQPLEALHVPSFRKNLVSVGAALSNKQWGCDIHQIRLYGYG